MSLIIFLIIFKIWYIDASTNDFLEITNSNNCERAVEKAHLYKKPLYLIVILNKYLNPIIPFKPKKLSFLKRSNKSLLASIKFKKHISNITKFEISIPDQFYHLSSIIDCEHLPTSIFRVKIYKQNDENRPLGFYLRYYFPFFIYA